MHGYAKYILTIEGLKGSPHSVTIPVITFSYGPKGSVSTGGYGSSSHGGRRTGDPDSVFAERAMDKYSPQIELANRIGSHLDKVTATLEEYHESDDKSTLAGRL